MSQVHTNKHYINKHYITNSELENSSPKNSNTTPLVPAIPPDAFDNLYKAYPRKEGTKQARRHFEASVKTQDDLDSIYKALANYLVYLKKNQVDPKFYKMASTWFNNWEDWVKWEPVVEKKDQRTLAEL